MPVYYFDFRDRTGGLKLDDVGSHLISDAAATSEALHSASELTDRSDQAWRGCSFEIRNESGALVGSVPIQRTSSASTIGRVPVDQMATCFQSGRAANRVEFH